MGAAVSLTPDSPVNLASEVECRERQCRCGCFFLRHLCVAELEPLIGILPCVFSCTLSLHFLRSREWKGRQWRRWEGIERSMCICFNTQRLASYTRRTVPSARTVGANQVVAPRALISILQFQSHLTGNLVPGCERFSKQPGATRTVPPLSAILGADEADDIDPHER